MIKIKYGEYLGLEDPMEAASCIVSEMVNHIEEHHPLAWYRIETTGGFLVFLIRDVSIDEWNKHFKPDDDDGFIINTIEE